MGTLYGWIKDAFFKLDLGRVSGYEPLFYCGAAGGAIWLPFNHESQSAVDEICSNATPNFGLGFRRGGFAIVRRFNGLGAKRYSGGGGCGQAGRGSAVCASHRNTICYAHNFDGQSICAINCRSGYAHKFIFAI